MDIDAKYSGEIVKVDNAKTSLKPKDDEQVFLRTMVINGREFQLSVIVGKNANQNDIKKVFDDCKEEMARLAISFLFNKRGNKKEHNRAVSINSTEKGFEVTKTNKDGKTVRKRYEKADIDKKIEKRVANPAFWNQFAQP